MVHDKIMGVLLSLQEKATDPISTTLLYFQNLVRAEAFQLKNKNVWFGKINSENNMEDD